ncbi:MAG: (2Fe-2S) ferredoxin domain-containing protein [Thioalkalivibrionaceae bacterium]
MEAFYERHLFFCTNCRDDRACCEDHGASELRAHAKTYAKSLGIHGHGKTRVNSAGCLDRCTEGPVCVVYPEGVWYTYSDEADVEEIVREHLAKGRIVDRLRI